MQVLSSSPLLGSSATKPSLALHPCLVPRSLSLLSSPSQAIKSHLVVESSIHMYCYLFHFYLASFKYQTIPYAIPHVSLTNNHELAFTQYMEIPQKNKPSHEFHLHCCLVLELDCLYNNTSFWLSLSTCEITYYLSTLSKRVSPLITLSFNHPKPTKGLDALSQKGTTEAKRQVLQDGDQTCYVVWCRMLAYEKTTYSTAKCRGNAYVGFAVIQEGIEFGTMIYVIDQGQRQLKKSLSNTG